MSNRKVEVVREGEGDGDIETGTYVFDYGENCRGGIRYEVMFAFDGENMFDTLTAAKTVAIEYEKAVHDSYRERMGLDE